jgi:methionyl-tRNA synthetase
VRRLNRLVEEREPWTLAKDDAKAAELDQALFSVANGLRIAAILLWPVIPGSCEKVLAALGEPADEVSLARAAWDAGTPGATVAPGDPLFPRVEVEESAA